LPRCSLLFQRREKFSLEKFEEFFSSLRDPEGGGEEKFSALRVFLTLSPQGFFRDFSFATPRLGALCAPSQYVTWLASPPKGGVESFRGLEKSPLNSYLLLFSSIRKIPDNRQ
jgi:hypothetical protein